MNLEHLLRPATATYGLDVIGVESDRAQVVWSTLPPGTHDVRVTPVGGTARVGTSITARQQVEGTGDPGAVELTGLAAGARYELTLHLDGAATPAAACRFSTLPAGRGQRLTRFATISDLHLGYGGGTHSRSTSSNADGADGVGAGRVSPSARMIARSRQKAPEALDHPYECAAAAIDEAMAWGAELIIVKGDVCDESFDQHWDRAAELLGDLPVPVLLLPGNHDTGRLRRVEPHDAAERRGLDLTRTVDHIDLPGVRIIRVNSTVPGNGWGAIDRHSDEVAQLAAEADTGVFIATHHQAQRFSTPLYWPHGIPGPDARRFARTVLAANPSVLVSSGHTHRCRFRQVAGLPWSEVSSTNHYPAMWAGYQVHDGSIAQTVRRIAAPAAIRWSEYTRPMLNGTWALWATGTLSDRSFQLDW